MNDEQHDNEIERAWERETFTLTPEQIREYAQRDARNAQTLPDVPFGDNEPAQLAAWGEGYDAFLESIEADVLRAKLRKAEARIKVLEKALMPFATSAGDEDIANASDDEPLCIFAPKSSALNYVHIFVDHKGETLEVRNLRRACEVLFGHPAPTTSESEADNE